MSFCDTCLKGRNEITLPVCHVTEKNKGGKGGSDCAEWRYGSCVANDGGCGAGMREGTCNEQTKKVKCRVPCNWKKDFGGEWDSSIGYNFLTSQSFLLNLAITFISGV